MKKRKQREYASAEEYITPFLKRYRRVFWFDALLAFLHVPLLVYLFIKQPFPETMIHVGWRTSIIHVSLAGFGIVANSLLLRDSALSAAIAYLRIIYSIAIRGLILFLGARIIGSSFVKLIETLFPMFLILLAYQGFYGWCVFLYSKWKNQLKENLDNQNLEPLLKTSAESGSAQPTQPYERST